MKPAPRHCWFWLHKFEVERREVGKFIRKNYSYRNEQEGVFVLKVCKKCGMKICEFITPTEKIKINSEYFEALVEIGDIEIGAVTWRKKS